MTPLEKRTCQTQLQDAGNKPVSATYLLDGRCYHSCMNKRKNRELPTNSRTENHRSDISRMDERLRHEPKRYHQFMMCCSVAYYVDSGFVVSS